MGYKLSIVIAARSGVEPALACLERLSTVLTGETETIAVNSGGAEAGRRLQAAGATVIHASPELSLAQCRHLGIERATGEIVAVLHERYFVSHGWADRVRESHREDAEVVAGDVAPRPGLSLCQWAMYLSEYAHIAPPAPDGRLERADAVMIPGGHVTYKRRAFERAAMAGSLWELDFHAKLFDAGARFVRRKELTADYAYPHSLNEYLAERWRVSRDYAALRARGLGAAARLAAAASRVLLPGLVAARLCVHVSRKPRYAGKLAFGLPWIAFFGIVQAAAEIAGWLKPGKMAALRAAPTSR